MALLLGAILPGCLFQRSQPGVVIASTPPGASIFVDGRDSGFTTPAALSLTRSDWHRIDLHLEGHESAARLLSPGQRTLLVPWTDGYIGEGTWFFPLFLEGEWIVFPLRVDDNLTPARIHVALEHSASADEAAGP